MRGDAPARRTIEEADLHKKWFIDFLDRVRLLCERSCQCVQPHRPALIFLDDGQQQLAVDLIEPVTIDFEHRQRGLRGGLVDLARPAYLGVIADPPQQAIGNTRCASTTGGNLDRAGLVDLDAENFSRALQDDLQVRVGVELQPQHDAEARAQRRRQQPRARGGPDEGERPHLDGVGAADSSPARVVAPMKVNGRTSMVWVRADGPWPMMMSSL